MLHVLPAINCTDLECVRGKLEVAKGFIEEGGWVHLDVTDAHFTFNKTWGSPDEWKTLGADVSLEVHLMVQEPEMMFESWLKAGAKRVIVHLESLKRRILTLEDYHKIFDYILATSAPYGAEVMLAINPETPVKELLPFGEKFSSFQILAVNPGLAGQKFYPLVLGKIRELRAKLPNAKIEVDGGVTAETAAQAAEAGADMVASATYIFDSPDPALAYSLLLKAE